MSQTPNKGFSSYFTLVEHLARSLPSFRVLRDFLLAKDHIFQSPTRVSVVRFNSKAPAVSPDHGISFDELNGSSQLGEELRISQPSPAPCRLFLVENVCAKTIQLLGEHFDIDPRFFAAHLDNDPWYRIENVAGRIPVLPSSQKLHDFMQVRYIRAQTVTNDRYSFFRMQTGLGENGFADHLLDAQSFMQPDTTTTRIPRKAGKLHPRPRKGCDFDTILCTRQLITVWFQKGATDVEGWTGKSITTQREVPQRVQLIGRKE